MAENQTNIRQEIVSHLPYLHAFARSLTRESFDADDLVQETLTKAISNLDKYAPGTNLRAWLCTIQRNTFYTDYRRRCRDPLQPVDVLPDGWVKASQEWSLHFKAVESAMQQLPPRQREAVLLVGGTGASYEEAAEICDCAPGTIKSRVSRARSTLLALLNSTDRIDVLDISDAGATAAHHGHSARRDTD